MSSSKEYKRATKNVLLLQVYTKYKREFLNPGVNEQEVWRKIAHEMREKTPFNFDEFHWCNEVTELRWEYERIKYIPATNDGMIDFKNAAKSAFQTIENPVPVNYPAPEVSSILPWKKYERKMERVLLLQVYAKYKRQFLNPSVNKQEVWSLIACEMKEKGAFNYDESYWCHKVEKLRQDYERMKYIPATDGEMIDFKIAAKNAFETFVNSVTPSKVKKAWWIQKQLNDRLFEKDIALLIIYTLHKDEFRFHANVKSAWKKIANEMNEKFPDFQCKPGQCHARILHLKKLYGMLKHKNSKGVISTKDAIFLKEAKCAFENQENPVTSMDKQTKEKEIGSLEVFNMYKAQILSPGANQQELWHKITETANKLSLQSKTFSVVAFVNYLRELQSKYKKLKNRKTGIATPEEAIFLEKAKLVFESTESEAISINRILHDTLSERCKDKFVRNLSLLRAYNIYKVEFSSPNEEDESVWEKIAGTVRISCSLTWSIHKCRLQLSQMKDKYQRKTRDWYLVSRKEADILFEEEKLAFETDRFSEEYEQMDILTEINTNNV